MSTETQTGESELTLCIETYNPIRANQENWIVRLDKNLDLQIFKDLKETHYTPTVRYRDGNHEFTSESDLSHYLLRNLREQYPSLLYLKKGTKTTYTGSKQLLKILHDYISCGDDLLAKLRIGERKFILHRRLDGGTFVASPRLQKAIKRNDYAFSIESRDKEFSLIWVKGNRFIFKATMNSVSYYTDKQGDVGFLAFDFLSKIKESYAQETSEILEKQFFSQIRKDDYSIQAPKRLKIVDFSGDKTTFSLKNNLFATELIMLHALSSQNLSEIIASERCIKSISGSSGESNFHITMNQEVDRWNIHWVGGVRSIELPNLVQGQTLFDYFMKNANAFKDIDLLVEKHKKVNADSLESWLGIVNLALDPIEASLRTR